MDESVARHLQELFRILEEGGRLLPYEIGVRVTDWTERVMFEVPVGGERHKALGKAFFPTFGPNFDEAQISSARQSLFESQPFDEVTEWCHAMDMLDHTIRRDHRRALATWSELVLLLHPDTAVAVPTG